MLPSISQDTAHGVQVNLTSGSFYWCDNYGLGVQEKELLRLEAKFLQHSLELDEGDQLEKVYPYVEDKAKGIKTSGSSLLVAPQVKKNLEALEGDAKFLDLLHSGFSEPIRTGKIWGDCKYREMVTFTKQRFGPAYALLIICIFGTGGRYEVQLQADARIPGDPHGNSAHRSAQNWHATVMNEDARQPINVGSLTRSTRRSQFLVLMHFMGRICIRKDILWRGLLPQHRWDRNGNRTTASRTDITEFAELFANEDTLDQEIHGCANDGLIKEFTLEDGTQCYTLKGGLESCQRYDYSRQLWVAIFAFAAYIYPRDDMLEQSFRATGKLLMPVMDLLWECLKKGDFQDLPYIVRASFIEASLSACRLTNAAHAKSIVSTVRRLQVPFVPPHLAAMLTWQESVSLRWEGEIDKSDTVLDGIFHQLPEAPKTDPDIRLYCAYGRLVFSRAENAIMRNDFVGAWQYVDRWESRSHPPSIMEIKLIRLFNTVFGRIARYTGKFLYARHCFERCLRNEDPSYRHIQFHLADIYCELGCAALAKDLLLGDVEKLRHTQNQPLKSFRRLALPLAEAYINLRQLNAARYTLEEVLQVYESMKHHDMTDQLGHVRTLISLARVDWYEGIYSGADERLKRATALVERYSTFIAHGFDFAFINLFHSVVKRALASDLLSKVPRGYFMAGNGTYFFEEISSTAWAGNSSCNTELASVPFGHKNAQCAAH
ncbi:hypothetical protein N7522_006283 [Penicillium canescens]|nr:hypothetical protein N7522_006283 [Penicillium canescens]